MWHRLPACDRITQDWPTLNSRQARSLSHMTDGIFRRRHLPHLDVEGKPYFVTACLSGSIPAKGLREIRNYRSELETRKRPASLTESQWQTRIHKLVFKRVDEMLDGQPAVTHLADQRLGQDRPRRISSLCWRKILPAGVCCDAEPSSLGLFAMP